MSECVHYCYGLYGGYITHLKHKLVGCIIDGVSSSFRVRFKKIIKIFIKGKKATPEPRDCVTFTAFGELTGVILLKAILQSLLICGRKRVERNRYLYPV